MLSGLETIDDDADSNKMIFVKVSEIKEAKKTFGKSVVGDELPSLVFFDDKVPNHFEGKLFFS